MLFNNLVRRQLNKIFQKYICLHSEDTKVIYIGCKQQQQTKYWMLTHHKYLHLIYIAKQFKTEYTCIQSFCMLRSIVEDSWRSTLNDTATALSWSYPANPCCPEVTAPYHLAEPNDSSVFLSSSIEGVAVHWGLGNRLYIIVAAPKSELKATLLQSGVSLIERQWVWCQKKWKQ